MSRIKTLQDLFKRYRRPGDFVIAAMSFAFALFLLASLPNQTTWVARTKLFAQPAFWPTVSVGAMVLFSAMHLSGALISDRIPGRREEVLHWIRALEYVAWFMAYVALVPLIGYLLSTILFCVALTARLGYRGWRWLVVAAIFGIAVVLLFKGFLQVKIPAGAIYDALPPGTARTFIMTYL